MDPNLDQRSKWNLIGYLKTKVEGQCDGVLTQDASKSQERSVHPMADILLYTTLSCQQADAVMLKIKTNQILSDSVKIELVETVRESAPECDWYWDAND